MPTWENKPIIWLLGPDTRFILSPKVILQSYYMQGFTPDAEDKIIFKTDKM